MTAKRGYQPSELEEHLVWQVDALKLPTPAREWRFHSVRRWRFDLAWPERKLAVEVEGGSWVAGAHNRATGFEKDCEKYSEAALLGWMVLRVTGAMVEDGRALDLVERAFAPRLEEAV